MKLNIIDKIEKEHPFNSRNWNYQKIIRYLLQDEEKRIIESMVIWHIKDGNGIECYSFGNISNEEIDCGQLVQNKISNMD